MGIARRRRPGCGLTGHEIRETLYFARPEHRVDLGNLLLQLIAIALGQAAGDDERGRRPAS